MILSQTELRQAQLLMLNILKKLDSFCKENDINYFLSNGTMLGAVRHNGFIPWDDDIDVGMLRSDYDKFCKLFKEDEILVLQNFDTDKGYGNQFSKLMLKNTKWIENSSKNTNRKYCGIYLDVFCFDKIPLDQKEIKKLYYRNKFLNFLLLAKQKYNFSFDSYSKKIFYKFLCFYSQFISLSKIKEKQTKLCLKYQYLDDCFVTNFGENFYGFISPEKYYKDLVTHKFEDAEFPIPREYDKILTNAYGNYMTPPDNPTYKHDVVEYDFGPYLDSKQYSTRDGR